MKTMIHAIIFDLGRVLIEYDHPKTLSSLTSVCRASEQDVRSVIRSLAHKLDTGVLDEQGIHQHLIETVGATPDYQEFSSAFCASMARNEFALALALEMRAELGVKIGVISNTNAVHTVWLRRHLSEFSHFDGVILSNEVGFAKPDPAIYQLALHNLHIEAHAALFIDDLPENVAGAQACGMQGIVHQNWPKTTVQLMKILS